MKKNIMFVLLLLLTLSSCSSEIEEEREPEIFDITITSVNEDGSVSEWNFLHLEMYVTLQQMIDSEDANFHYFEFLGKEHFSEISDAFYFLDLETTDEFKIVIYNTMDYFTIGDEYYLHIVKIPERDYYNLSDLEGSVFYIENDTVKIHNKFQVSYDDNLIPLSDFEEMIGKANSK